MNFALAFYQIKEGKTRGWEILAEEISSNRISKKIKQFLGLFKPAYRTERKGRFCVDLLRKEFPGQLMKIAEILLHDKFNLSI